MAASSEDRKPVANPRILLHGNGAYRQISNFIGQAARGMKIPMSGCSHPDGRGNKKLSDNKKQLSHRAKFRTIFIGTYQRLPRLAGDFHARVLERATGLPRDNGAPSSQSFPVFAISGPGSAFAKKDNGFVSCCPFVHLQRILSCPCHADALRENSLPDAGTQRELPEIFARTAGQPPCRNTSSRQEKGGKAGWGEETGRKRAGTDGGKVAGFFGETGFLRAARTWRVSFAMSAGWMVRCGHRQGFSCRVIVSRKERISWSTTHD